jgi:hypothetical protein
MEPGLELLKEAYSDSNWIRLNVIEPLIGDIDCPALTKEHARQGESCYIVFVTNQDSGNFGCIEESCKAFSTKTIEGHFVIKGPVTLGIIHSCAFRVADNAGTCSSHYRRHPGCCTGLSPVCAHMHSRSAPSKSGSSYIPGSDNLFLQWETILLPLRPSSTPGTVLCLRSY